MAVEDLATHQQTLVALFEVARGHHQQLTSFSILVILGTVGFAVTDTFRHADAVRRYGLAVAVVGVEVVIGVSLYWNALLHNRVLAEAVGMNDAPPGAPNVKAVLATVGDAPAVPLLISHVSLGLLAAAFIVFGTAGHRTQPPAIQPAPPK